MYTIETVPHHFIGKRPYADVTQDATFHLPSHMLQGCCTSRLPLIYIYGTVFYVDVMFLHAVHRSFIRGSDLSNCVHCAHGMISVNVSSKWWCILLKNFCLIYCFVSVIEL